MRDDLTIVYAYTVEEAMFVARDLGLSQNQYLCIGKRCINTGRGFDAKTGRIILVGDVELKDLHRADFRPIFRDGPVPILRIQKVDYV